MEENPVVAQSLKEKIWNHIDENSDDIINLCSDLVKIPSVNPPGDMTEIASYIGNYLKKHDVSYETFEPDKGKTNIVSKIGGKNGLTLSSTATWMSSPRATRINGTSRLFRRKSKKEKFQDAAPRT